jgi:restriction system protein
MSRYRQQQIELQKISRMMSQEAERRKKALERSAAAEEKERKKRYLEEKISETLQKNEKLEENIYRLENLLLSSLNKKYFFDFKSMLTTISLTPIDYGNLLKENNLPSKERFKINPPVFFGWIGFVKENYEIRKKEADILYAKAIEEYKLKELERNKKIEQKKEEHKHVFEKAQKEAEQYNNSIHEWEKSYQAGDSQAVAKYCITILKNSNYPDGFSKEAKIFFSSGSKHLIIEYEFPTFDQIISKVKLYKYVKSLDVISSTPRSRIEQEELYKSVVAQVTLSCLHELFQADHYGHIETITFNGHVPTISPATGRPVRPCIITVRTNQGIFSGLELSLVDPIACLHTLNASVSPSPAELAPVRPILELNMLDPRFIQEQDVISALNQSPNLMDLTPSEFESLIANLFQKMGLDTKLTRASKDGGVDCVAFDPRPIFGGKVVIQAKRYKNTVGVSAVRELFGTMINEGASKGILVTTSGYGKAAFEFAADKPIELLDGGNLLYLLSDHAQLKARIVMPEDVCVTA